MEDIEKKKKQMLAADCMKKSESSEDCRSAPSPEDELRRSSGSPGENPGRRSVSPVEMIDGGAGGSPPRTPTPEPTASPLELLEAPMAKEDEEAEEEEEEQIEDGGSSSSSSSPAASPQATIAKEFAQSPSQREEQSSTGESCLANLNLTQNQNLNLNENHNQKQNTEEKVIEVESQQRRADMEEDLQRAEPATIIVSPYNNEEEMVVGRVRGWVFVQYWVD